MWTDYPYPERPAGYKYYYLITLGFHTYGMLKHLLINEKKQDFFEMVTHHFVTVFLYGFSYMMNTPIGIVIALLHDLTDIVLTASRFWAESKYKTPAGISAILMLIGWIHTRIIVLF